MKIIITNIIRPVVLGLPLLAWADEHTSPQPEPTRLPEMVVAADGPWEQHNLNASTLDQVFDDLPLLVTNTQGTGAQTDLQIRGSSFSEAGLAIGPVALRNPQTEHFNANLPLAAEMFESARLLVGLDNTTVGGSHLAGSVRLDLAPVVSRNIVQVHAAENGEFGTTTYLEHPLGNWNGTAVGAAAFAGWSDLSRGLDYPDNTLKTDQVGARLQFLNPWSQTDVIFGRETREFGARGFYGVSPALAAFERTRDTLFLATGQAASKSLGDIEFGAYWREFTDEYTLPEIDYLNEHESTVLALALGGETPLLDSDRWTLDWTASVERETLESGNLGDHRRHSAALSLVPTATLGEWSVALGGAARSFSHESPWFGTLAGLTWKPSKQIECFVEYVESVRQPSYTELNYESPASLGNSGLDRESAREFSGGIRIKNPEGTLAARIVAFQRKTSETIDWVKDDPDDPWQAEAIGDVRTQGVELAAEWTPRENMDLEIAYTWMEKSHESDAVAGRYILDYPQHQLSLAADWRFAPGFELRTDADVQHQTDNAVRTSDRTGMRLDVELAVATSIMKGGELTLFCENALDDDFQNIPGQLATGRRFGIGYRQSL